MEKAQNFKNPAPFLYAYMLIYNVPPIFIFIFTLCPHPPLTRNVFWLVLGHMTTQLRKRVSSSPLKKALLPALVSLTKL